RCVVYKSKGLAHSAAHHQSCASLFRDRNSLCNGAQLCYHHRVLVFVALGNHKRSRRQARLSDIDPAEVVVSTTPIRAEQFSREPEDIDAPPVTSKKPEREGLPPGYRMRADAHYVEHITGRRGDRGATDAGRPGAEFASERHESRDRIERLLSALTEDVATIE